MVTSEFLLDLADVIGKDQIIDSSKLASATVFGSSQGHNQQYNPDKQYKKGDIIPYITANGELIMITAIEDTTGPFNPMKWEEWNVIDEIQGMYNDLIVMSWEQPSLRRNKVWIEIKNESLADAKAADIGNNTGVLIFKNFIVSHTRPTMASQDVIWGQITENSN